jgi:large subunit ribosomal protein L15
MQQHDLQPNPGAKTNKRRIGRGNGSGQGTTAGKGTKGQQARSGRNRRGFEGGQLSIAKRMPYKRGFTNHFRVEFEIINVGRLDELELDGLIDQTALARAGVVDMHRPLKILGDGEITRAIQVRANRVTAGARAKIEAAGGTVEEIDAPAVTESGDESATNAE